MDEMRRRYRKGDDMTRHIRQGARVKIEALGLDGSTILHTMERAVETIWTQEQDGEVLALVQTREDMDDAVEPWRVLVDPDDLYDPDVWDGELDRSLVVLDIVAELGDVSGPARLACLAALRTMVEHDASPEALMDVWRRSGEECDSMSARCVRMAYRAHEAIDREEETYIADRLLTLSGPRKEKR
jgi:hypothetical protein